MICKRCLTKGERGQKLRDLAQKWRPLVSGMVIDRNVVPCPKEACEVTKEQMKQQLAVIKSKSSRAPLPELVRLGLEEKSGKARVEKLKNYVTMERECGFTRAIEQVLHFRDVQWLQDDKILLNARAVTGGKALRPGARVIVKEQGKPEGERGVYGDVISMSKKKNVTVKLRGSMSSRPSNIELKMWFSDIPYDRQMEALLQLENKKLTGPLLDILAGDLGRVNEEFDSPAQIASFKKGAFSKVNDSQRNAINFALGHKFAAIQGPPGCGKSTSLALQAVSLARSGKKVLICTRDNAAADHVVDILLQQKESEDLCVSFVRVVGDTYKECIPEHLLEWCSHVNCGGGRKFARLNSEIKRIRESSIVVATTCTSGGGRFKKVKIDALILDESNTFVDPELLIPIAKLKPKQITIYGDQKQIGPFVWANQAKNKGYGLSLIERLAKLGIKDGLDTRIHQYVEYAPTMLTVQYRMHPGIAAFPSHEFYQGKVKNGVKAADRRMSIPTIQWPNPQVPMMFWDVKSSKESRSEDGKSIENLSETAALAELLDMLHKGNVSADKISVITFYNGEVSLATSLIRDMCSAPYEWTDDIEIETVDSYEGRDVDIAIIVCVRANRNREIGFLSDYGRFCVSLTRARFGLFVIGHVPTLESNEKWKDFIDHCRRTGTLREHP